MILPLLMKICILCKFKSFSLALPVSFFSQRNHPWIWAYRNIHPDQVPILVHLFGVHAYAFQKTFRWRGGRSNHESQICKPRQEQTFARQMDLNRQLRPAWTLSQWPPTRRFRRGLTITDNFQKVFSVCGKRPYLGAPPSGLRRKPLCLRQWVPWRLRTSNFFM